MDVLTRDALLALGQALGSADAGVVQSVQAVTTDKEF